MIELAQQCHWLADSGKEMVVAAMVVGRFSLTGVCLEERWEDRDGVRRREEGGSVVLSKKESRSMCCSVTESVSIELYLLGTGVSLDRRLQTSSKDNAIDCPSIRCSSEQPSISLSWAHTEQNHSFSGISTTSRPILGS